MTTAARARCALTLGVLFVLAGVGRAADEEWKAGLAAVKITPPKPVCLWHFPTRPFEKVESDLYAKALYLQDAQGHGVVILTCDLLGFRYEDGKKVIEQVQKKTRLKREQIVLACSLSHTTPQLGHPTGGGKRAESEADAQAVGAYTDQVAEFFIESIEKARDRLEPARLSWGNGKVDFVVNRRVTTDKGVIQGVNPKGVADRTVPVLRVDSTDGKLRAVLFGAAADACCVGDKANVLSADYPGYAQAYVQEKWPGVQAMFMLGCAGNTNPLTRGSVAAAREHGDTLGKEVCRVLETRLIPVRGPLKSTYELTQLPCVTPSREELDKQVTQKGDVANRAQRLVNILDGGHKLSTHQTHPFAMVQFGTDLTLVALPGQVVAEYRGLIEKDLGPARLWVAGNCNDLVGYHIPTARILEEEGLEARGFFSPKVEETLLQKVRDQARKVGRELPETKSLP